MRILFKFLTIAVLIGIIYMTAIVVTNELDIFEDWNWVG